jgi:alanyl-tRNA synthetase
LVNREILANQGVESSVEDREAAVAKGAMALFGEKYDDEVRVVSVPGFSVELCGGTHVRRTGDIGTLRVVSEGGIAAGVRRIEAQTGTGALEVGRAQEALLSGAARQLKTSPERLADAIARLVDERRQLERELSAARDELAKAAAQQLVAQAVDHGGVKVLAARFAGDLKAQADRLRDQLGSSVVILIGQDQDKVSLVVATSKDLAGKKIHAGNLVKALAPLVGGNGGGRPDLATAGGKDPAGIDQALAQGLSLVQGALSA